MNNTELMSPKSLLELAIEARKGSYSPYSNFKVGAALLTRSGKVYTGCNIENAAFSPTVCAERVAIFKAISEGERDFVAIAVVGGASEDPDPSVAPCGVCRQVMAEFCDADSFKIYLIKSESEHFELTLKELLPYGFGRENL